MSTVSTESQIGRKLEAVSGWKRTLGRPVLFLRLLILVPILLPILAAGCGGPMPPQDPFHLAESKSALGRGNHWFQRGCPAEADRYFELGLEQARLADDVSLIVKALNARGAVLMSQNQLNDAALVLQQALELSLAQASSPEIDSVLGNLGLLALKANRREDAKDLWNSAISEAKKKGLSPILYHCNLARLALAAGDQAEFTKEADLALSETEIQGAPESGLADAYNLAALKALSESEDQKAEAYLDLALNLDRKNENQIGLAQDLETLAGLQSKTDRPLLAAASLDRAFYLFTALNDRPAQARVLKALETLSKTTGHPKTVQPYKDIQKKPALFDPINRLCP
ncbi:MAG: hypothetical protein LBS44_02510 [Deltaproteobacteria bacterium]|jgi:tetratricopeptide (TPR) repeat protein|nr:hypothetical protein [Deltaproteobacteria bacterium]